MFITLLLARRQRAIVRRFEEAGATGPAVAMRPEELGLQPGAAWYQLVGHAVLRCPGEGRYYLDLPSWLHLRHRRRGTAVAVSALILVLLVLLMWLRVKAA
jgi:hypothetical protein